MLILNEIYKFLESESSWAFQKLLHTKIHYPNSGVVGNVIISIITHIFTHN